MTSALSYMAEESRRADRDRFLCALFAPAKVREGLYTLLAFNVEIAKSREVVSEPLLGEIRLQWWRDAIERIYSDPNARFDDHAVLAELAKCIGQFNLSRNNLDRMIDMRSRDMSDTPPEDETELRSYALGTAATLNSAMMEILHTSGPEPSETILQAAEHIGIAWALTGILRASAILAKYNRVLIPQKLMQECGFDAYTFLAQKPTPEIQRAVKRLVDLSRNEIGQARLLTGRKIEKRYLAVFLQARLAELYLNRIEKFGFNPFSRKIEAGRAGRQLKLTLKAVRGSF